MLFPLIISNTDDFGRLPGDAFTIKNVVLPSSRRPEGDFESALDILADAQLIERYQVDGVIYLQVNKFDEHQPNLAKRTKSKFPEFPGSSGNFRKVLRNITESKLTESNLTENLEPRTENPELRLHGRRVADALFERFWDAYPKKRNRQDAEKAWAKRRPNEALLNTMLDAIALQRQQPEFARERFRFAPYPATWLNDARWTDEVDTAPLLVSEKTAQNIAGDEEALRLIAAGEFGHGTRR